MDRYPSLLRCTEVEPPPEQTLALQAPLFANEARCVHGGGDCQTDRGTSVQLVRKSNHMINQIT